MKHLLAAFAILLTQGPQPTAKASIEGVVVHISTGAPVDGVRVVLTKDTSGVISPGRTAASLPPTDNIKDSGFGMANITLPAPQAATPEMSDASGKFTFRALEPGSYRLSFARNGFVFQEYGQRSLAGPGMAFRLSPGQTLKDVTVRLTPTGTLSGRVVNTDGSPMANVPVELFRNSYGANGQKALSVVNSSATNDRGEYRFPFITPGRYLVGAGTNASVSVGYMASLNWTSPNELAEASAHMFYPGVYDSSNATMIDVTMGADLGGLDFHLGPQQKFRIRGRVIDATGKVPANVSIGIGFSIPGATGGLRFGGNYKKEDGTFEFTDVVPGSYGIMELGGAVTAANNASARPTERPGSSVEVVVLNADVNGVVLTVASPSSMTGHLTVDGKVASAIPGLDRLRILFRAPLGAPYALTYIAAPLLVPINKDGGFKLENVSPGDYRVSVVGIPPEYFVREARYGGADVLTQLLRFDSFKTGQLEIVISPNAAQLSGTVVNERQQPVSGVQTVLVPDRARERFELYKTASTDEAGHFTMTAIPPGDYKLFAWETIEPNFWFDPDILRRDETKARAVHLTDLSKETIEVRSITVSP